MSWNRWFWLLFGLYLLSFALPAFGTERIYFGYEVVVETIEMLTQDLASGKLDKVLYLVFIMSMPNWIIVLLLILRWRASRNQLRLTTRTQWFNITLLTIIACTGAVYGAMWWVDEFDHMPIWGYYLWMLSTIGMGLIHYLDCKEQIEALQEQTGLEKHLIE